MRFCDFYDFRKSREKCGPVAAKIAILAILTSPLKMAHFGPFLTPLLTYGQKRDHREAIFLKNRLAVVPYLKISEPSHFYKAPGTPRGLASRCVPFWGGPKGYVPCEALGALRVPRLEPRDVSKCVKLARHKGLSPGWGFTPCDVPICHILTHREVLGSRRGQGYVPPRGSGPWGRARWW